MRTPSTMKPAQRIGLIVVIVLCLVLGIVAAVQFTGKDDPERTTTGSTEVITPGEDPQTLPSASASDQDDASTEDAVVSLEVDGYSSYDAGSGVEELEDGTRIEHEDPVTAEQLSEMQITSTEDRLVIPSVGIDDPLLSMGMYRGADSQNVINPPTSASPYVVREWGSAQDPEDGMVVLAMHSIRGKDSLPGSKLIDIDAARATVQPGDPVIVAGNEYRVTGTSAIDKDAISTDTETWDDRDGKLLIVTCLQRTSGSSTQNIVITAELAD